MLMLASLVKRLCSNPHSAGRRPYLSRAKRVIPGTSLAVVFGEKSPFFPARFCASGRA